MSQSDTNEKKICVFCSSSKNTNPKYYPYAEELGKLFVRRKITCVTGGGWDGCMGALNKSVYENGGKTIGVTHELWVPKNDTNYKKHKWIDIELVGTGNDMADRKRKMKDISNGFIILPGGPGTFDELWEVISDRILGFHNKPIVIVDVDNYYAGTKIQIKQACDDSILLKNIDEIVTFVSDPNEAVLKCTSDSNF